MRHGFGVAIVALGAAVGCLWLARPPAPAGGVPASAAEPGQEPSSGPKWDRPRFTEAEAERRAMVRSQIERRGVANAAVLEAMCQVPRHEFVPPDLRARAYADCPLPIGHGQTISQPYIVAYMTEALQIKPGDRVLEVGTGSGYQAAVLSELTPHVYSIEIVRELGEQAKKRLAPLGYKTIQCKIGDGYLGWPEHAPFDAIIVTCAPTKIPPPLLAQLKPGGRLCIPVGASGRVQELVLVTKDDQGQTRTKSLLPVSFVPLTRE